MKETEINIILRQAMHEIRNLRRQNEILSAQVAVAETFRAAILGVPQGQGMSPDITWEIERWLSRDQKVDAQQTNMNAQQGEMESVA